MGDCSASAPNPDMDDEKILDWQHRFQARGPLNSSNARCHDEPERATNPYETQPAYNPSYGPINGALSELTSPTANTGENCPGKEREKRIKKLGLYLVLIIVVMVIIYFAA